MIYEIRLGGGKVFHMGFLTGILGRLTIMKAPDFAAAWTPMALRLSGR